LWRPAWPRAVAVGVDGLFLEVPRNPRQRPQRWSQTWCPCIRLEALLGVRRIRRRSRQGARWRPHALSIRASLARPFFAFLCAVFRFQLGLRLCCGRLDGLCALLVLDVEVCSPRWPCITDRKGEHSSASSGDGWRDPLDPVRWASRWAVQLARGGATSAGRPISAFATCWWGMQGHKAAAIRRTAAFGGCWRAGGADRPTFGRTTLMDLVLRRSRLACLLTRPTHPGTGSAPPGRFLGATRKPGRPFGANFSRALGCRRCHVPAGGRILEGPVLSQGWDGTAIGLSFEERYGPSGG